VLSVGRLLGVLSGPGFCGRGPGPLLLGGIVAARAIIRIRGYTPPRRFGATGLLLGGRLPVRLQLPPGRPRTGRPGSDTVNCAGGLTLLLWFTITLRVPIPPSDVSASKANPLPNDAPIANAWPGGDQTGNHDARCHRGPCKPYWLNRGVRAMSLT